MSVRLSRRSALMIALAALWMVGSLSAQQVDPKDWSDWEKYREGVQHPCAAIKAEDLNRARSNIEQHDWAGAYVQTAKARGDSVVSQITPEYLANMLERTTPGCVGPCPACRAKGLPWHPNGQWSWSSARPDDLTCSVCKTVFPNDEFPEEIVLQSKWDPEQKFGFIGGETFRCFGYTYARPSISGMIRARKVAHVLGQLHSAALAYALTEDAQYAQAVKAIFLRLAEVFPKYLVRAGYGYGEYADCDPHVACERINDLPVDELVYPPNKPDRRIYTGYWSASRLGSSGMDGGAVSRMAQAYDLTCLARDAGGPVYSEDERLRVERDVLLESSYLAACDEGINNKSVGNRAGAAMVGMVVGHPGLVRFGLDGFVRTVEEWFLPDGGTSESPAYAMMTMGGIRDFGLMFRGYSDPEGFAAPDGSRLDGFDACRDTRYGDCWQGMIWTLQGDLRHPPSADSYRTTSISADFAELIAVAYPTDEHIALLKEIAGADLTGGSPERAIFYRDAEVAKRQVDALSLPDVVFPFLAQGYLRTGPGGRDSLAMLNASDYGGHHHIDSLNLYYWKDGRELLSDLGYLWDHPDSYQTRKSFSHNLALVDGQDQRSRDRHGSYHLFATTPRFKVMEASSDAYEQADVYRRTCVQVDHGQAGSYLLDIFRVSGGRKNQYVFHGPNNDYALAGLQIAPLAEAEQPAPFAVRFHLPQVSEIYVDDVEIRQVDADGNVGPQLAPNGSADRGDVGKAAPGWGIYSGDGSADSALVEQDGERCIRFRALKPHENGRMNVALMVGESDGYRGVNAIPGTLGATYSVRFKLRGDAEQVSLNAVTWPTDPASAADRTHMAIRNLSATSDWREYEARFTLPNDTLPLENAKHGKPADAWRATWQMGEDYEFSAFAPAAPGETVSIGDGWGQRDHRNSDRGATLPYVVRTADGRQNNAFVSVFAGGPAGELPVRSVSVLQLPEGAPADAVAVQVETSVGRDIIVSMLEPQPVSVQTPFGKVETDGRIAVVVSEEGIVTAACLVGGSRLSAGDKDLECEVSRYEGAILDAGSAPGESWFVLDGALPEAAVGHVLVVRDGDFERAYPIRGLKAVGGEIRAYTKLDNAGFEARSAQSWLFVPLACWERR